jgi:hypothetical protein
MHEPPVPTEGMAVPVSELLALRAGSRACSELEPCDVLTSGPQVRVPRCRGTAARRHDHLHDLARGVSCIVRVRWEVAAVPDFTRSTTNTPRWLGHGNRSNLIETLALTGPVHIGFQISEKRCCSIAKLLPKPHFEPPAIVVHHP